ncbi:hypothetical protein JCM8097_005225 [Rhodosporidiobolus ruineniae]
MDKLPTEVLCRSADLILDEPIAHARRPRATVTLFSLLRTSKAHYQALRFKLYQDVHLVTREQATSWLACYTELVVRSGGSDVKAECIARYGVRKLVFYYRTREYSVVLGEEDDEDACSRVPDLKPALRTGLLAHLRSFEISECFIDPHSLALLLGPHQSTRQSVQELKLSCTFPYFFDAPVFAFCLEALEYLDSAQYASAISTDPVELAVAEPEWELHLRTTVQRLAPSCQYEEAHPSPAQLAAAQTDYPTFLSLYLPDLPPHANGAFRVAPADLALHVLLRQPLDPSPFSSLRDLELQLDEPAEITLIFHTSTLAALKTLRLWICEGHPKLTARDLLGFRRSITHSIPGLIIPPELQCLKYRPKRYRSTFEARYDEKWLPLTTRELQEYPFQPYRGPLLDLLDLELMSFKVIKPVSA